MAVAHHIGLMYNTHLDSKIDNPMIISNKSLTIEHILLFMCLFVIMSLTYSLFGSYDRTFYPQEMNQISSSLSYSLIRSVTSEY